MSYYFVLVFYNPFSIAITSLGEEKPILRAFRMFVRSALVWFVCFLFLLVSRKGFGCDYDTPWTFLLLFLSLKVV